MGNVHSQVGMASVAKPGHFNDPDMLQVRSHSTTRLFVFDAMCGPDCLLDHIHCMSLPVLDNAAAVGLLTGCCRILALRGPPCMQGRRRRREAFVRSSSFSPDGRARPGSTDSEVPTSDPLSFVDVRPEPRGPRGGAQWRSACHSGSRGWHQGPRFGR